MDFPESPPDGTRQRLTDLRNGLLHLHKCLLDSESATYDHDIARITSKGQLLNLVLHDPYFAWLHELSELVVQIDETLDAKEPATPADGGRLLAQARELLAPAEATGNFRKHYLEALQRDPNVVMAHAQAMKMLASIGEPKSERRTQQDETE
jgi:hypothetical protein